MDLYITLLISCLCFGIVICLFRLFQGPSLAERTVAGDGIMALITGIFILVSILFDSDLYLNAALIISLLGFITTLAVSRYLEMTNDE